MDVGMDVGEDLVQPVDPVGIDPVGLHGVVDPVLDHLGRLHAHGLVGIGRGGHGLRGAVQRRDVQEDVRIELTEAVLHGLRVGLRDLRESQLLRILQLLHHDAGIVDDGDALGVALGPEHNEDHQGVHGREEDRYAEGRQQEGLLLDLVQVLPLDDDA